MASDAKAFPCDDAVMINLHFSCSKFGQGGPSVNNPGCRHVGYVGQRSRSNMISMHNIAYHLLDRVE